MNGDFMPIADTELTLVEQPALYQTCRIEVRGGKTPLAASAFRLLQFQGQESVSDLFEFQLELRADTSADGTSVVFDDVIGQSVTVGIAPGLDVSEEEGQQSFQAALAGRDPNGSFGLFNGIVAAFGIEEPGAYHLTMRPSAWRMSLVNRYRIFKTQSVCDVLKSLCREHRVNASFSGLQGEGNIASTRIQDWLQAGETDLDFMRRLMSKAHIYYYFQHFGDRHVMVFDNQAAYPPVRPGNHPLRYTYTNVDELGAHQSDVVSQYNYQQSLSISGVDGVFTLQKDAADVVQPSEPLADFASFRALSRPDIGSLPFKQYKIVQYGFSDNEARDFVMATDLAMRTASVQLSGASHCPDFRVGHRFRMQSSDQDVRPELENVEFVLTQVQHQSSLDGLYSNQFSAALAAGLVTAAGVEDTQQGMILAHVTTAKGSDTLTHWPYYLPDEFELGRNALLDRNGLQKRLNAKGVYVRFSCDAPGTPPVWVKLASHMQTIPEVGSSVWVARANDESELPEVQSIVQADGSKTITDSGWTAHTQVGNSFSSSFGDSRSLHFGQPWTSEAVSTAVNLVESAYARNLFRDSSYSRGGSYSYATSEQSEKGMLSESWSYGSTYNNSWGKEAKSFTATGRSYHESVTGKCDTTLASTEASDAEALAAVSASRSVVWGDTYNNSTSNGKTKSVAVYNGDMESDSTHTGNVQSTTSISGTSTTNSTHHGKVVNKTQIHADSENNSTITGTSSNNTDHSIVHNVTKIGAQSSSSAIGANNSNDVVGVSNSNSATGVSNRNSVVGANVETSLQGTGNTMSVTGMENRMTMAAMVNSLSVTGETNSVSVSGPSTTVEVAGPGIHVSAKSAQVNIDLNGPVLQIPMIILVL